MISKCREPRSIQVIAREWRDTNPGFKLGLDYDAYKEASKQLEIIMGHELLATMSEVDIPHNVEGIWLVTSSTWEVLQLTQVPDLDIEANSKMTNYAGILGYYRGWPIILGPGVPRYGVRYVFNNRELDYD